MPHEVSSARRRILVGLGVAVAMGAAGWWRRRMSEPADAVAADAQPAASAANVAEPFATPLRLPGSEGLLADLQPNGAIELRAAAADFPIFPGRASTLWHYASSRDGRPVANPLLRLSQGQELDVTLYNALDEETTAHWHGLAVDEANDGSGLHPIAPGAQRQYRFRVSNRAGLYWYHAHPHGNTGKHIQRGLAGLLLVDDEHELKLRARLGLDWGSRDLPLLLADKQIDANNSIVYKDGADDWIGNRVLVNWTPEPHYEAVPGLYRLRLLNGCNARLWRLGFLHRGTPLPFLLIGTDGGLLEKPWRINDIFLAPAQRIDVIVDFSNLSVGERVLLTSFDYMAMENEDDAGPLRPHLMADHPGAVPMGAAQDIMQFRIVPDRSARRAFGAAAVPQRLSDLPEIQTEGLPTRRFRLTLDAEGRWLINQWNMHLNGHEAMFHVRRGTREIWEIHNALASMPHPLHVHGFQFRVLSRSISPPDIRARAVTAAGLSPHDLGLLDTILIWPGETVRIVLDFSQPFRGTQRYMIHCHNLEHEDMGMMVTFAVDDEAPALRDG